MNSQYVVDQSKWAKLDIFNQMGNIYSEVGRSLNSRDKEDRDAAIIRAIDLFDATVLALSEAKSPKLREVLRAKEQFIDIAFNENPTESAKQSLDRYFMNFAVAARLR
ncbi:MAG: hypothetical protein ACREJM_07455 [Candidatus Saccharimonadales bacterium]